MSDFIPLSVPLLKGNELKYVTQCIEDNWVSSAGKFVEQFENDIARYIGAKYAVACSSGTAALEISLKLAGVRPDDEVIVPTLTFIATVNSAQYLGAKPIFMDADEYYNIDAEKTLEFITEQTAFKEGFSYNKKTGKRISAIIPVHVFGGAACLEKLLPVCQERNIRIIEDATESLGTRYSQGSLKNKHMGTVGDLGCFSFNGNKIITTGGGGMIVTDNKAYAKKAKYLTTQAKDDDVRFIHNEVGYNFRMNNIQAALGVAQLEMLPEYLKIKRHNYGAYKERIDLISGLFLAKQPPYAENNCWMYALQIDKNVYGRGREELMDHFTANGVQTRPVWHLNHLQVPYKDCESYKIKRAYELVGKTLNIPCSVNLKPDDLNKVIILLSDRRSGLD